MLRTVKTKYGELRGIRGNNARITAFKGIPFAAPPIGENRWRAPKPCECWEGIRDAYCYAPIPMQDVPGIGDDIYCREWHVDSEIPVSEDCLYLNVWTPAKKADEKLPVVVWYFGGAFQWGYTSEMEFDGEMLARRRIVVVTVSYRIAVMGFLAHPELSAEAPDAPSNFGLLDQKAGLDWVIENIASFGGDPDNICIAGQSAGGASTMQQLTTHLNAGKVKSAAIFSGLIMPTKPEEDIFTPISLTEAEKLGEAFFDFLGVSSLEEARRLPAEFIRDKYGEFSLNHPRMFPIDDGVNYIGNPLDRLVCGEANPVPIITGFTKDEFIEGDTNIVENSVRYAVEEILKNNPKRSLYTYGFKPHIPGFDNPGCFHSVDLWFWFETLAMCWRPFTGHHYDLANTMSSYFVNFIKTGNPNGKDFRENDLPQWKTSDMNNPNFTIFS
ncbi:carboxylesterase/lipase family protein [Eubacterium xylanophilum]|uniref:carboxylesterase/lipase family protein n=1 Tax=Eubacterium xylanophilum TaxID=39497 RepID=UPI0004B6994D|nr:carboxylesterase family protein [Eubacterium xylanophilum]